MAALRASLSHELLRPVAGPVRAMATFRPAVRPVRIAPTVSRKASTIVCSAATDAPAAAVAEPTVGEVKSGVAHLRFQRGSADKVRWCVIRLCSKTERRRIESKLSMQIRRVLDVIRGRSYEEALVLCEYMPYRACEKIIKCLMSVGNVANYKMRTARGRRFCVLGATPFRACGTRLRRRPRTPSTTRGP
ncbi:50S ribosomal protein L22, chloroplastic [Pleodorina starrii]|uniref:50S ribosomal protein L22, chloroplastic n=1 Tax=Pleodorina starrii TaxID=330485 RepID=A0A9W6BNV2_9CHLO|nr:50S ribosomal protein L22, chloroplastic [Pleodorina starrii]